MFDILEGESLCYQYFIENKITNRTQLRESLKTNPIKELTKSFIENMFANYKQGIKTEVKKIKPLYKIVCFNDAHIPFHDDKVLQMIFELIRKEQPDELVLNGDIIDCYWESRFIKDPGSKEFLQHECNTFVKLIAGLRKYIPNTAISYISGNHEDRIKLETWKNPSFYGVSSLELPNLLKFDKLKIEYHPVSKVINNFEFTHGTRASSHASYSAKLEFEQHSCESGMSGHTHRMGSYTRTSRKRVATWYENGCTCTLDPTYVKGIPNWQQGFSVIYQYQEISQVMPIIINQHKFLFNGVIYD